MEMETPLPSGTDEAGPEIEPGARTDGLAAAVSVEHQPETPSNGNAGDGAANPKRPGRPPTHGRYSKAAGSDGKNPVTVNGTEPVSEIQAQALPETRVVIPPDLVSQVVQEGLTLGEKFAAFKLTHVAKLAGLTQSEIETQLEQGQLGDSRKKLISDLTPYVFEEWGIDPELSPTTAILLLVGPVAFATVTAYWSLAKLAEKKLAMEASERNSDAK